MRGLQEKKVKSVGQTNGLSEGQTDGETGRQISDEKIYQGKEIWCQVAYTNMVQVYKYNSV